MSVGVVHRVVRYAFPRREGVTPRLIEGGPTIRYQDGSSVPRGDGIDAITRLSGRVEGRIEGYLFGGGRGMRTRRRSNACSLTATEVLQGWSVTTTRLSVSISVACLLKVAYTGERADRGARRRTLWRRRRGSSRGPGVKGAALSSLRGQLRVCR